MVGRARSRADRRSPGGELEVLPPEGDMMGGLAGTLVCSGRTGTMGLGSLGGRTAGFAVGTGGRSAGVSATTGGVTTGGGGVTGGGGTSTTGGATGVAGLGRCGRGAFRLSMRLLKSVGSKVLTGAGSGGFTVSCTTMGSSGTGSSTTTGFGGGVGALGANVGGRATTGCRKTGGGGGVAGGGGAKRFFSATLMISI